MVEDKGVKRSDPTGVKNCNFLKYETFKPWTKNKRGYILFQITNVILSFYR